MGNVSPVTDVVVRKTQSTPSTSVQPMSTDSQETFCDLSEIENLVSSKRIKVQSKTSESCKKCEKVCCFESDEIHFKKILINFKRFSLIIIYTSFFI